MSNRPTILLIDADGAFTLAAAALLDTLGYTVVSVLRGPDTLPLVFARRPVLIVMDFELADGDGRDVLRNLKREPRTSDIPVVVCCRRDYEADRAIAAELGAACYLPKTEAAMLGPTVSKILFKLNSP